ncbi:hypothetical protein [Microbacterium sp. No. 7]|uniref:hypothetical protein n=1 Tax=Microbacterium sp. No. 7 TaxID=1714373 RepID=UPI0006D19FB1|nr:hypothetical protein [Microbacterium sp. No. 7]ALJ19506.1 hypothetical protein AOA12_06130 [Microbacterium sp. No. 7]
MIEEKPPWEAASDLLETFGIDPYDFFMVGSDEAGYVTVADEPDLIELEHDGVPYGTYQRRVRKPWPDEFPVSAFLRLLGEIQ